MLQLNLVDHQTLKHLSLKNITRRQRGTLFLELGEREVKACPQFVKGYHFVIDDGNDAIGR